MPSVKEFYKKIWDNIQNLDKTFFIDSFKVHKDYNELSNDALELDLYDAFRINNVNGVFVNPPFHDEEGQGSTQHKLWIDFTIKTFNDWLSKDGYLYQISPSSFARLDRTHTRSQADQPSLLDYPPASVPA